MPYFFIVIGALLRLLSHPPNFTPIAALALFGGVYLSKRWALFIPVVALFFSDLLIGLYSPVLMAFVYAGFILIGLVGWWLKSHKKVSYIFGSTLVSSLLFFIISNFGVWIQSHSTYPHNLNGLLTCYTMALPFLRNSLSGDLFFVTVLFGSYELARYLLKKMKLSTVSR